MVLTRQNVSISKLVSPIHYQNRVLCRVPQSLTTNKEHVSGTGSYYYVNEIRERENITTGIAFFIECLRHSANNTRQIFHRQRVLCGVLFFGHSAKTLPIAKKHSAKKNTRQIKNQIFFKNSKTFFKILGTTLQPTLPLLLLPYPLSYHFSLLPYPLSYHFSLLF
jgi:hypothetical protein